MGRNFAGDTIELTVGDRLESRMQFDILSETLTQANLDCVVVGVFDGGELSAAAQEVDKASAGVLRRATTRGDFALKLGETALLVDVPGIKAPRVVLVGQGTAAGLSRKNWRRAVAQAALAITRTKARSAALALARPAARDLSDYQYARAAVDAFSAALYQVNDRKTAKKPATPPLERVLLAGVARKSLTTAREGLHDGQGLATGARRLRDLANLPANICTPEYLADTARNMAKQFSRLKVTVLDAAAIRREKMGCFLAVTQGSDEPPRFIVFDYRGGKAKDAPIVLVGKGITFDTGGISLKDPPGMDEMKFDMTGAATVFGAMTAVAEMRLPLNVIGLVPACENMPSGRAIKPGDIVVSAAGQSVEILNTDAEGRLILCDALHYARRYKPSAVIDIATLTGACVIALGAHHSGVFANDTTLAQELVASGIAGDDRAWQMPVTEEYAEQLKSNFADLANVGGRDGGAITAAAFLGKFTQGLKWAHLDIAGTAYLSGAHKGATGRPLGLLVDFLTSRARKARRR
jgi:leucyl aminopeptidase